LFDLKGFALSELGRDDEMYSWLDHVTAQKIPGGESFYYAASLMDKRGNVIREVDYLRQALELGYGSLYRLRDDIFSPIGIKTLREAHGLSVEELVEKMIRDYLDRRGEPDGE
ncbi:MAG: hypothetical protein IKX19_12590, partial [Clostridia bacterium]|nr:hypothetical protein [Clostridia bacterium]